MKISARNVLKGKVIQLKKGPINSLVKIEIAPGVIVTSVVTGEAATELKLKKGAEVYAVIKASSILLGVSD
jgi:molybdopterin-binding protein